VVCPALQREVVLAGGDRHGVSLALGDGHCIKAECSGLGVDLHHVGRNEGDGDRVGKSDGAFTAAKIGKGKVRGANESIFKDGGGSVDTANASARLMQLKGVFARRAVARRCVVAATAKVDLYKCRAVASWQRTLKLKYNGSSGGGYVSAYICNALELSVVRGGSIHHQAILKRNATISNICWRSSGAH
jgi:hypothetical protein